MNPGRFLLLAALALATLGLPHAARAGSKPVLVYYMPWHVAKPHGDAWGWHWTMDHFNPDVVNASGERQIASWYYPLIGPYDSSDPAVLEYHVLLMKLAGIDGVIVDWYGFAPYLDYSINDRATARLFACTHRAGLKFAICYEDQTISHMIDGNYLAPSNAIPHAQRAMLYLQTNFFSDPSYFRLKGRPLLLNFGPQYFLAAPNWADIFSVLAATNQPAFFTEDIRLASGAGAFSWPPMWMGQAPGTAGVLSSAALKTYLNTFEQNAAAWPAFISSAFPRFHDIYQKAGVRNYWGYLGDANGETLRQTLGHAMTNSSTMVQIVTWNDFGEGTMVEPTREYGYRDLGIIQDFRRQYLDKDFSRRTNDLSLALRFYNARKQFATNSAASSELDRVFTNIVAGNLPAADLQLQRLAR
ncbi:MAG: hypothetical protein JWR19_2747 [Pedosphaera sp.]|nr:hypothetical protein [Pedosphaera sp.]